MSTTQDPKYAIRRANRPPLGDPGVDIASNLAPASIEVTGNLAEDTVIAGVMDIAEGDHTVALFANPLSGGSEEILYIDERLTLRWARHVNPVADVDPGGLSGWSIEVVMDDLSFSGVTTVVNTDGTVWAFAVGSLPSGHDTLFCWELTSAPEVPGGQRWHAHVMPIMELGPVTFRLLPVYYCNDRPATPVVFVDCPARSTMFWLMANHPLSSGEPPSQPWRIDQFAYLSEYRASTKVAGVDSPDTEFSQGPLVSKIRMWCHEGSRLRVATYDPRTRLSTYDAILGEYDRIIAPWTYLNRVGVVVQNSLDPTFVETIFQTELMTDKYLTTLAYLDCPLEDLAVWQDAAGLAHIYGRDADGSLRVAHQVGWVNAPEDQAVPDVMLVPSWDVHTVVRPDGRPVDFTTTRPLVASVARYDLDAYPDDMPSQHVMAQGAEPGETCAIYTQDLDSSLWHQERMRLIPETLPKPYVVPRYEATLTVKNALGTPIANCEVSLTADAPVDLEVGGAFYRTGTITPVRLVTNGAGQVTLRVVARSLAVPQMHVTVSGLAPSLSVQMAAGVHKFLSGNATLPNHSDGFTAEAVATATKPDGRPLFPGIQKGADATGWPPSAQDVVTWCRGVFAVDSGSPLPTRLRTGLANGEDVVAFSFQTRDPRRPALETFTSREQLDARRESLGEQGVVDEIEGWFGDVWQGIQEGVVDLAQATVNLLDQTIELIVTLADEVEAVFVCAWQDVVSAAHAVEAVFVAVEAKIEEVIDWLKWAFGFADALKTAKVLRDVMDEAPRLVSSVLAEIGVVADGFFIEKEAEVRTYFEALKTALGGQSLSSLQGPTATVPTDSQPSPQVAATGDQVQSPHSQWFAQQLMNVGTTAPAASAEPGAGSTADSVDSLIEQIFTLLGDAVSFETLSTAMADLTDVFAEFFSGKDPGSVASSQLVDLLDFAETVVVGILQLLDELTNDILRWSGEALAHLGAILDTPLTDVPFLALIWDFVVEQSGLPPADYPLTMGMLGAFLAGYPFTVVSKCITGEAPFAGGGIPVPPAWGDPWHAGQDLSTGLLLFQAFQGVVQTLDVVLDAWYNLNAADGGATPIPGGVVRGFAVAHFLAYVVGDYPWFWGYEPFTENKLPYFRYMLTFFFNMYDLFLAYDNETLAEMFEGQRKDDPLPPELVEKRQTVLMLSTTAFGWIRIGINLAEYLRIPNRNDGTPATWYDTWNLWINLTAYIQTATGFVRFVLQRTERETPAWYAVVVALAVKAAIDLAGDLYSGVSTVVQPFQELFSPASIDVEETEIGFYSANQFQPYASQVIPASGGWPAYSWSLWTTDQDNPQPFQLPAGLELVTPNYQSDLGRTVQIVGTPTELLEEVELVLRVDDGYGPSSYDTKKCSLLVSRPPAGIPVADFTGSPETARAPATIQLTDVSTGSPTSWTWQLDDGAGEVTEKDPVASYPYADTYTVTLVAGNAQGYSAPVTRQLVITAPAGTPVADFTYTDDPRSGAEIHFTDKTTGGPTSYLWDFGDGRTSTERNPVLTYASGGDYVVSLLCANASGWGVRKRHLVSVQWA